MYSWDWREKQSAQNPLFSILNKNYWEIQAHILSVLMHLKQHLFYTVYMGKIPWDLLGVNRLH